MASSPVILATKAKRGARAAHISVTTANRLVCECGGDLRHTMDSRPTVIGAMATPIVRRQRRCDTCGKRSATIEMTEADLQKYHRELLKEIAVKIIAGMTL